GDANDSTIFRIGGGIVRARMVSIVVLCCCGESSLEVRSYEHVYGFGLISWNLKKGKEPTVEPAGRCLWPNNTGLLQRASASVDDEQN
ncbi:hypothetical protein Tco_0275195, partial [Tanacetum coccineum]